MTETSNYNLKKPGMEDFADIDVLNQNFDAIDIALTPNISQDTAPNSFSAKGKIGIVIGWLANRIKAITGKTNWWEAPATTLDVAASHINGSGYIHPDATATTAGFMSAADKTKLNGATSNLTPSQLIMRDSSGRAQVVSPIASTDIANRSYVDENGITQYFTATQNYTADSNTASFQVNIPLGYQYYEIEISALAGICRMKYFYKPTQKMFTAYNQYGTYSLSSTFAESNTCYIKERGSGTFYSRTMTFTFTKNDNGFLISYKQEKDSDVSSYLSGTINVFGIAHK